ncbi:MAG: alpha-N-arabinofuranosidase, partial [Bacillota bacterium]
MKCTILCNMNFSRAEADKRIFGSFAEHMGRVIYSGIFEPGHPQADVHGFRMDVMQAVQDMGVSCMRYPGGNFVSNYDWRDGVGPR